MQRLILLYTTGILCIFSILTILMSSLSSSSIYLQVAIAVISGSNTMIFFVTHCADQYAISSWRDWAVLYPTAHDIKNPWVWTWRNLATVFVTFFVASTQKQKHSTERMGDIYCKIVDIQDTNFYWHIASNLKDSMRKRCPSLCNIVPLSLLWYHVVCTVSVYWAVANRQTGALSDAVKLTSSQ